MDISLMSMLDFLVESQFNESFTKEEIAQMSVEDKLQIKAKIRLTFINNLLDEDIEKVIEKPIIVTKFDKQVVTGEFYPDNYIEDKQISNR